MHLEPGVGFNSRFATVGETVIHPAVSVFFFLKALRCPGHRLSQWLQTLSLLCKQTWPQNGLGAHESNVCTIWVTCFHLAGKWK